jgi:aspartyl-tRNA(Asn)/glutamyl-tRNA(Gln) amidotransferase subunit C
VKISELEVRYVAALANLTLTEEETHKLRADLDQILGYIDKLNELDTSNVPPMAQVLYEREDTATLRDDAPHVPLGSDAALANAPLSGAGHFKVPKVIER